MRQFLIPLALLAACATVHADDDHLDAKLICQKFALKELKSPTTAQFESISTVAAQPSLNATKPNTWDSVGYVDSQNSYGAMIRSDYSCTIQKTGPNKWRLIEMYWHTKPLNR